MKYKGKKVKLLHSCYSHLNGTETTILDQDSNNAHDVIVCLDIPHPEDDNLHLWVNVSELEFLD